MRVYERWWLLIEPCASFFRCTDLEFSIKSVAKCAIGERVCLFGIVRYLSTPSVARGQKALPQNAVNHDIALNFIIAGRTFDDEFGVSINSESR